MKKKLYRLLLFIIFSPIFIYSQQDTVLNTWVPTAAAGFNVSQLALSNWTQGGSNSLTWTLIGTGSLGYRSEEWNFRNNLKVAYGRTKLGGEDFRTNDNDLYFESVISKNISWAVDPYFSNTLRTNVTTGYSYKTDPPVEIADLFDPGYLTQSLGFTYDKVPGFKTRLGFAVQEIFTRQHVQYSDDTTTAKIEKIKIETGLEWVSNLEYTVAENLLFKSILRLFSRYESLDVWDVRWDNVIVAKVNGFINMNLTYLLVYEKAQSLRTQMKQGLQLGIVYTIL